MENKGLRILITGLLVLGLGLGLAHAVGCSYSQIQCVDVCEGDGTSHETCVRDCGCSSVGLQHAQAVGCSYSQIQCIDVCEGDGTPHDTCVKDCGCSSVGMLHTGSGDGRCRFGCSSKCNEANKLDISEHVKEHCKDVCYSLCAKGIDITATAA